MRVPEPTKEKIYSEPESSRERIFNAAIDLFAEKGFNGTSIRNIAEAVEMNTANLYHHFGNKEGLLLFILEQASKSVVLRLKKTLDEAHDLDHLERYKALLASHLSWTLEHQKESKIFFLDEERLSSNGIKVMRKIHREVFDIYYNELIKLERAGYVKGRNLKMLGIFSEGVLQAFLRYQKAIKDLRFEDVLEEIVTYILGGITYRGDTQSSSVRP